MILCGREKNGTKTREKTPTYDCKMMTKPSNDIEQALGSKTCDERVNCAGIGYESSTQFSFHPLGAKNSHSCKEAVQDRI